jgi:competence protein ComEA
LRFRLAELMPGLRRDGPAAAQHRRRSQRAVAGIRWAPGRSAALAMVLLAVLAVIGAGGWVWAARPHRIPTGVAGAAALPAPPISPGGSLLSPLARPSGSAGTVPVLVVDVVGKVRRPGVYRLPTGARVNDAVAAAGGVLTSVDPASVNLARKLSDGEQLVIGLPPAAPPAAGGAGSGGPAAGGAGAVSAGPVDLNSATPAQLDALPGVGPVLAQRIVDWRTQHGRFGSVDQLRSVSGIGDAKFRDLAPLVVAG